jgi:hypothetical protein
MEILDFEEIIHNPYSQSALKHIAYLTRRASFTLLAARIDVYQASKDEVFHRASWYFNIVFPFLPVNRLAQELVLEDETRSCSASIAMKCIHGICLLFVNIDKGYCQCHDGWIGEWCEKEERKECHQCASSARCLSFGQHWKPCACPLGRIGRRCRVRFNSCQNVFCQNNGTCISIDERATSYACICSEGYFGDRCQWNNAFIVIGNIQSSLRGVTIIHFLEIDRHTPGFMVPIERRLLSKGLQYSTQIALARRMYLPTFSFMQIFKDANNFYGSFYLVALVGETQVTSLNTEIISENHCPHVDELLNNRTLSDLRHLARVKYYGHLCLAKSRLRCFYDEVYICLCDEQKRTDCLIFDHSANNCSADRRMACQNRALCLGASPCKPRPFRV